MVSPEVQTPRILMGQGPILMAGFSLGVFGGFGSHQRAAVSRSERAARTRLTGSGFSRPEARAQSCMQSLWTLQSWPWLP